MPTAPRFNNCVEEDAPIERNGEEEPQRRNRTVDGRRADAVRGEMQLEKPQLFGCRCLRSCAGPTG